MEVFFFPKRAIHRGSLSIKRGQLGSTGGVGNTYQPPVPRIIFLGMT
jgi:hypothetical protein